MPKKDAPPVTPDNWRRLLEKELRKLSSGQHRLWRVWTDFVELAALSYANIVERKPARQERYLKIREAYTPEEQAAFPRLLGMLIGAMEDDPFGRDHLGELFMLLELGNDAKGQFFTPIHLCKALALCTLGTKEELGAEIAKKGYITVSDPCVGAGAMLLAGAGVMLDHGFNPQQQMYVVAQDVDYTAAHMAFVQLSLTGLPGCVIIGNTLTMECREVLYTPMHYAGGWPLRLKLADIFEKVRALEAAPAAQREPPDLPETTAAAPAAEPKREPRTRVAKPKQLTLL